MQRTQLCFEMQVPGAEFMDWILNSLKPQGTLEGRGRVSTSALRYTEMTRHDLYPVAIVISRISVFWFLLGNGQCCVKRTMEARNNLGLTQISYTLIYCIWYNYDVISVYTCIYT